MPHTFLVYLRPLQNRAINYIKTRKSVVLHIRRDGYLKYNVCLKNDHGIWNRFRCCCYRAVVSIIILATAFSIVNTVSADNKTGNAKERLTLNRMCAEWEPALGTLIRWPLGIPSYLVKELARDDSLYILVENQSQQNQALSSFQSWGVNIEHCRFIQTETYSHWTRDWGPHSVFHSSGQWMIMDPIFDGYPWVPGNKSARSDYNRSRGYEEDDLVNSVLAAEFACSLHALPAYLTGGNIMVDGHGTAFSTQQMLDENSPLWNESEFLNLLQDYAGITTYNILSNTEDYGIQHIDCAAKLLDEETILVQELPSWHPEKWRMDRLVSELQSLTSCYNRPYKIVRIYCGSYNGNSTAAYTNSLILNKKVLVPMFGISSDSAALQTYREAMPGYEVIGFYYSNWYYYDALHCRTMAIFDRFMLRLNHCPLDSEVVSEDGFLIAARIDGRSEEGLIPERLQVKWRKNLESEWDSVYLTEIEIDSFQAVIPDQSTGTKIEYYIQAVDSSGRTAFMPRGAPEGYYTFTVLPGPVLCGDANGDEIVNVSDAVHIINYIFIGGDPPDPPEAGDCNCDENCNISDAVWIINYVFINGNMPCDTSGDGQPDC
jgi:agmatine/peptidylarginine deiminase